MPKLFRPLVGLVLVLCCTSVDSGLWEWRGAAETGKDYAVGDPPPRAPRMPPNVTCNFGGSEVPCVAAHNYFTDFDPIVTVSGALHFWPNDACAVDENEAQLGDSSIAFVRRGGCAFSTKVRNLMTLGAAAVVIVDSPSANLSASAPSDSICGSGEACEDNVATGGLPDPPSLGEERGLDIPVAMVSHAVGEAVLQRRENFAAPGRELSPLGNEIILQSASLDLLRGRGSCQCDVEAPEVEKQWLHAMHREGVKERLDYVVDEGKRALMCFSPVRTLASMRYFAPKVEPFSTVAVSQALLDDFFRDVFPRFRYPIVLVTSDYNSDRSAPQPFETDHSAMLDDPKIAHWFSDNWLQPLPRQHGQSTTAEPLKVHPKLTVMPIGINDRHVLGSHGDRRLLMARALSMPPTAVRSTDIVLANFHHSVRLGWWSKPVSGGRPDRALALAALAPAAANKNRSYVASLATTAINVLAAGEHGDSACASNLAPPPPPPTTTTTTEQTPTSAQKAETNAYQRRGMRESFTLLDPVIHFEEAPTTPGEAWAQHANFAFELSPQGNGVDSHRTWEALLLGTIPIVRRSFREDLLPCHAAGVTASLTPQSNAIDALYEGLPVVVVDDWAEVANITSLRRWHRELSPLFSGTAGETLRSRLSVDYWLQLVKEKQKSLRRAVSHGTEPLRT